MGGKSSNKRKSKSSEPKVSSNISTTEGEEPGAASSTTTSDGGGENKKQCSMTIDYKVWRQLEDLKRIYDGNFSETVERVTVIGLKYLNHLESKDWLEQVHRAYLNVEDYYKPKYESLAPFMSDLAQATELTDEMLNFAISMLVRYPAPFGHESLQMGPLDLAITVRLLFMLFYAFIDRDIEPMIIGVCAEWKIIYLNQPSPTVWTELFIQPNLAAINKALNLSGVTEGPQRLWLIWQSLKMIEKHAGIEVQVRQEVEDKLIKAHPKLKDYNWKTWDVEFMRRHFWFNLAWND